MKTKLIIVFVALLMVAGSLVFADEEQKLSFNREANGDVTVFKLVPLEVMPKVPSELPGVEAYALKHGVKGEHRVDGKSSVKLDFIALLVKQETTQNATIYKYTDGRWKSEPQVGHKEISMHWPIAILFQWGMLISIFCISFFYGITLARMAQVGAIIAGSALACSLLSLTGYNLAAVFIGGVAAAIVAATIEKTNMLSNSLIVITGLFSSLLLYDLAEKGIIWEPAVYLAVICSLAIALAEGAKRWRKYREE